MLINIDYDVDPISICKEINIPVQGGLDPKVLLTDKENLKKEALKIFRDVFKDHPYIFNLGPRRIAPNQILTWLII